MENDPKPVIDRYSLLMSIIAIHLAIFVILISFDASNFNYQMWSFQHENNHTGNTII
jgi:hypothetical protein